MSLPWPSWSVVFGEQPTAAKWSELGANDDALAAGTGLNDGALTPAKLVTGSGTSWAWQSYTPTTSNITITSGTLTGKYAQLGKLVKFEVKFILGASSAIGSDPQFGVPVAANSRYNDSAAINFGVGVASMYDLSATTQYSGLTTFAQSDNTKIRILPLRADLTWVYSTNVVNASQPLPSWATGDVLFLTGEYEAA